MMKQLTSGSASAVRGEQSHERRYIEDRTLSLGTYGGIRIRMHALTAFLLVALLLLSALGAVLASYVIGISVSLLVHELGHAFAALRRGYHIQSVIWLPFGSLTLLDQRPQNNDDLPIALAGLGASGVLAALLAGAVALTGNVPRLPDTLAAPGVAGIFSALFYLNIAVCLLNIVPALPVDGGQALRSYLARTRSRDEATQIVAMSGTTAAFLFAAMAPLIDNPACWIVAAFLFIGTAREIQAERNREVEKQLSGVTVTAAMLTEFQTLSGGSTLREAVRQIGSSAQGDFPVVQGGEVTGIVCRETVHQEIAAHKEGVYISEIMDRKFVHISPNDLLLNAAARFRDPAAVPALVIDDDCLIGMLTAASIRCYITATCDPSPTKT